MFLPNLFFDLSKKILSYIFPEQFSPPMMSSIIINYIFFAFVFGFAAIKGRFYVAENLNDSRDKNRINVLLYKIRTFLCNQFDDAMLKDIAVVELKK